MTGLLGYGGAYGAIHEAELLLLLGTDFPFTEFLPGHSVKKVQIDKNPKHIGRRTAVDLGLVGDIKATVAALLKSVREKTDDGFLDKHLAETKSFDELSTALCRERTRDQTHTSGVPGRDTQRTCLRRRDVFCRHGDGMHMAGETYQGRQKSQTFRFVFVGVNGQCRAQCVWRAVGVPRPANDRPVWRRGLHHARAGRPIDASGTKDSGGSDHPE